MPLPRTSADTWIEERSRYSPSRPKGSGSTEANPLSFPPRKAPRTRPPVRTVFCRHLMPKANCSSVQSSMKGSSTTCHCPSMRRRQLCTTWRRMKGAKSSRTISLSENSRKTGCILSVGWTLVDEMLSCPWAFPAFSAGSAFGALPSGHRSSAVPGVASSFLVPEGVLMTMSVTGKKRRMASMRLTTQG